ncbi:multiple monosaccharide ABC transporter substrate-binding protein [Actinoplanes sp. N902-109]|uniref:multiple monosaccharide ABC transporter substrate-binding protein n=1 Tax=Actinoplanes sp. (strain N902-109) TaxID=649831 RepID=UPI0003293EC0|nr:multiple monosaccharide ABC transporter substrate-binding protein [Actinoplanes sp. N902-109]AGL16771.1 putative sugar ABC transporter, substrate-binding protein [Actinoplanes sp. N902-109]
MAGKIRALAVLAITAALAVGTTACSSTRTDTGSSGTDSGSGGGLIGIAMPTKSLERWNNDGAHLEDLLKKAGYTTTLQYADNKVDQQITQLQNMINQNAKILVVASIDGTALGPVLDKAAQQKIKVIAYDRLINATPNVDYYATFDNYQVGKLQGQYIVKQLGLDTGKGPFNLEPFAGSSDDNNAKFFFAGAWDVLKPYIDSKKLVIPSGKKLASDADWKNVSIDGWSSQKAQSEMDNRINSFYTGGKKVDVVLSPNDSLALGIEQSLESKGYKAGAGWPVITGQDADLANTKNILAGLQSMTVWKDTRTLGDQVAKMVDQIVKGQPVETNDTKTYDNGVKVVPAYLLPPVVVTKDDVKSKLVDSGFYTADKLGL